MPFFLRVRRINIAEHYVQIFEKTHREKSGQRAAFRLFTGLVAYLQIAAAALLAAGSVIGHCRPRVAVLPLLTLAVESVGLFGLCLAVALRLACKAEICQVWRHVLTVNLFAFLGACVVLGVAAGVWHSEQADVMPAWAVFLSATILLVCTLKHILVRGPSSIDNVAVSFAALLAVLGWQAHRFGARLVWTIAPIPLCLVFLVGSRFRDVGIGIKRQRHSCPGLTRDVLVLAGYGLLLLPAVEATLLELVDKPRSLLHSTLPAIPFGLAFLGPSLTMELGGWAETIAFHYLIV